MWPVTVTGLSALMPRFRYFLIDQFGVLRDADGPYPRAARTLARLKQAGARVVLLSNSGKRAAPNSARLAALGFDPADWELFLTSGETAWRLLRAEEGAGPPRRCLLLSRDDDISAILGLNLTRVSRSEEADVILLAGSEGNRLPLSHYRTLLETAARRRVPCLCTNPDKQMLEPGGGTTFGAGQIAELYAEMGGSVRWIGKPFPEIYAEALRSLGDPPREQVLCVGDSLEHDIAGAVGAGLASVLVRTGIVAGATDAELQRQFAEQGVTPDFLLPQFDW